jgi:hypothetical protein
MILYLSMGKVNLIYVEGVQNILFQVQIIPEMVR